MSTFLTLHVLQNVKGVGPKTICKISRQRIESVKTSQQIYKLVSELASSNARISTPTIEEIEKRLESGKRIAELHDKLSIKTINYYDDDYPAILKEISSPPITLFARGNVASLKMPGLAVIGTRNVSPYAQKVGQRIGEFVAEQGLTVISGLAIGCDTAGHTGCLNAGGITVAFVATPLDQTYPKENTNLAEEIVEKNGCIVSEYPVGTPSNPYFFIQRDRLQCGLANGVIVVETGVKGGTWHAVNGCLKLGKPLGCFTFKEEHYTRYPHSRGNKLLIQKYRAVELYDSNSLNAFIESACNVHPAHAASDYKQQALF